ncbi:MAG: hypothetical protein ACRDKB_08195 [Actinomycetota bacterium]
MTAFGSSPWTTRMMLVISLVLLVLPTGPARGDETSTVDGCTVTFVQGKNATAADVTKAKQTFDNAAAKSDDMKTKVTDACGPGKALKVNVVRDDPNVFLGSRPVGQRLVNIDVGDIDKVKDYVTSEKTDADKKKADEEAVAGGYLIETLAHEIDHARDGEETDPTKRKHRDPPSPTAGESAPAGPADQDSNEVHKDLKDGVTQNTYVDKAKDGTLTSTYTVNGQKVVFNASDMIKDLRKVDKKFGGAESEVQSTVFTNIPRVSCTDVPQLPSDPRGGGGGPAEACWQELRGTDADADGIANTIDNCQGYADPQQADSDGDGVGDSCTDDDDADGFEDVLEHAVGSHSWSDQSTPQHFSLFGTEASDNCSPGYAPAQTDTDADGLVGPDDFGCSPFLPQTEFPAPAGAEFLDQFNVLKGGAPIDTVWALPVHMTWDLDTDGDGVTDETANFFGPLVLEIGPIGDSDSDGKTDVTFEINAIHLDFFSPTLGHGAISRNPSQPSTGVIEQSAAGPDHFPAISEVFLGIRFDDRSYESLAPSFLKDKLLDWPDFGIPWVMTADTPLPLRTQETGQKVADIVAGSLAVLDTHAPFCPRSHSGSACPRFAFSPGKPKQAEIKFGSSRTSRD